MKLLEKFLTLSRGKQITLTVFSLHFLTILALLGHHLATKKLRPPRPMVIRTLAAQPPTPPTPLPTPKPLTTPIPKTATPKPQPKAAQPKPKTKPVPTTVKKPPPVPPKIEQPPPPRPPLSIPSKIQPKAEIAPSKVDPTYGEMLIAYLQSELDLPEYGEVKAKIEIDPFGRLVNCEILESKSGKNAEFLKNRLQELAFPLLSETQSFTITFRNVEVR